MKVLGIAVRVSNMRSTTSLVLLEGTKGSEVGAVVLDALQVTGGDTDWATHVGNIAQAVRGHVQSICPDAVIVRRADQAPHARNSDGPKVRLLIEGGVVAVCMDVTAEVRIRSGKECGKALSTTKDDLEDRAESLVDRRFAEAAAAALSALG